MTSELSSLIGAPKWGQKVWTMRNERTGDYVTVRKNGNRYRAYRPGTYFAITKAQAESGKGDFAAKGWVEA